MRIFTIIILFLFSIPAKAGYSVEIFNNIFSSNRISFGTVGPNLCQSSTIVPMASLSDGNSGGICINDRTAHSAKIYLIIPLRIVLTSTEAVNITFTKLISAQDFDSVALRNIKNQAMGGGMNLLNSTIPMNNQTINAELELGVIVAGPGALNSYSSDIEISISPGI